MEEHKGDKVALEVGPGMVEGSTEVDDQNIGPLVEEDGRTVRKVAAMAFVTLERS